MFARMPQDISPFRVFRASTGGELMRATSTLNLREASPQALDLDARALALEPLEEAGSTSHWRFASDTRAALQLCIVVGDVLAVAFAGIASSLIWDGTLNLPPHYWGHIIVGCIMFVLVMQLAGMYRFVSLRRHRDYLLRLSGLWAAVVLTLIAVIFLSRRADEYSRGWMLLWALGGWSALATTRLLAWQAIRQFRGQLVTRIAVVGEPAAANRCAQRLQAEANGSDTDVVGVLEAEDFLGPVARLQAADMRIDEIVLAVPHSDLLDLDAALGKLGPRVFDIKVGLDFGGRGRSGRLILVPIWHRPLAGLPNVVKRAIDACASAILLVFVLPLMAAVAGLVKLDSPGPVMFKQQRFGLSKKPFKLYKFRSMHYAAANDPAVPQARRRDPRVTRVGRFLRQSSLDELPQLLNVLRGDMSLVGPRPHATSHDEKYAELIEGYSLRHHVKPGITGWAQVHGWRGETDTLEKMERRVEYDIYYINNWSLLLDIQILFRTLVVVLGQRNAY
jgi:Undecaprenyl-phosphate glucose phosphotransferase